MTEIKFKPLEELAKEGKEMDIVEVRVAIGIYISEGEPFNEVGLLGYFHLPNKLSIHRGTNFTFDFKNNIIREEAKFPYNDIRRVIGYRILGNSIDLQEKK